MNPVDEWEARAVLGVERGASPVEVRIAYRRLAKETHPDAGGSRALFDTATAAYQLLCERNAAEPGQPEERREPHPNTARDDRSPRQSEARELPHGLRLEAYKLARRGLHHADVSVAAAAFDWAQAELALLPSGRFWTLVELATSNRYESERGFGYRYSRRQMAKALVKLGDPRTK